MLDAVVGVLRRHASHIVKTPAKAARLRSQAEGLAADLSPEDRELVIGWAVAVGSATMDSSERVRRLSHLRDRTRPFGFAKLREGESAHALIREYRTALGAVLERAQTEAVGDAIDRASGSPGKRPVHDGDIAGEAAVVAGAKAAAKLATDTVKVLTRLASGSAQIDKIDAVFARAASRANLGLDATTALGALRHTRGILRLVQTALLVKDAEQRWETYKDEFRRLSPTASLATLVSDAGQLVAGCVAVSGLGTFAALEVAGKSKLAAEAFSISSRALGNFGVALAGVQAIHGLTVLASGNATFEEKLQAVADIGAGGAVVGARFLPMIAPALNGAAISITVNVHLFKAVVSKATEAYVGTMANGMSQCFRRLQRDLTDLRVRARRFAAALDMRSVLTEPAELGALDRKLIVMRDFLDDAIRDFLNRATKPTQKNRDPGNYSVIRRRFIRLEAVKLQTDTDRVVCLGLLLEIITKCLLEAKAIFNEQLHESLERH